MIKSLEQIRKKLSVDYLVSMNQQKIVNSNQSIRSFREGIYQNFNYKCVYCGSLAQSLDHAKPKAKGGETVASNLLPACLPCNRDKGSQELFAWYRARYYWTQEREAAIANWIN